MNNVPQQPPGGRGERAGGRDEVVHALQRIERILSELYSLFDEFFRTYLNAKFQRGKPTDRWGRR